MLREQVLWNESWIEVAFGESIHTPRQRLGWISGAVVNLRARQVTHLLVRRATLFDVVAHRTIALPAEWIEQRYPNHLSCIRDVGYNVRSRHNPLPEHGSDSEGTARGQVDVRDLTFYRTSDEKFGLVRAPAAERGFAIIDQGSDVYAVAQRVGTLDRLILHPETKHITHVVIRGRHLNRRLGALPIEWIRKIGHKRLYLDTRFVKMDTIPVYPPDDNPAISERIGNALLDASPMGLGEVQVRVVGKSVELRGITPTETMRLIAEQIAHRVSGGLPVKNRLETDQTIVRNVVTALQRELGIAAAHVQVSSLLGAIRLEGTVPTPAVQQRIEAIAAHEGVGAIAVYNLTKVKAPEKPPEQTILFGLPQ